MGDRLAVDCYSAVDWSSALLSAVVYWPHAQLLPPVELHCAGCQLFLAALCDASCVSFDVQKDDSFVGRGTVVALAGLALQPRSS